MRRIGIALKVVVAGLFAALGCSQAEKRPTIAPPKEDFHIPPPGLFAKPTKYPDGMLNQVPLRKNDEDDFNKLPPAAGPGMNGGMSGSPAAMGR